MMCCISSIGPDETNTETKNEACVTNNAAVDLWKDLPTHLPNRMDWNPWSLC